jgi:hypothetical protein
MSLYVMQCVCCPVVCELCGICVWLMWWWLPWRWRTNAGTCWDNLIDDVMSSLICAFVGTIKVWREFCVCLSVTWSTAAVLLGNRNSARMSALSRNVSSFYGNGCMYAVRSEGEIRKVFFCGRIGNAGHALWIFWYKILISTQKVRT